MRLPAALQAWGERLAWFDEAIAAALGPLVAALDPLVALPGPRLAAGTDEPDGIDGLHRRGSYERLLVSEWALADAAPDEFLRRAAGGEHLFLAPRRRAPRVERELVALFDAGPDQLGAARLVHVALWILLARRAERAGARFRWGVLQAPGATGDASSPAMLRRLLAARTLERASDAHRQEWRDALAANTGERWTIGANADADATHAASVRLRFTGTLDVAIATRQHARRASLAAPPGAAAARLLSGRFEPAPADAAPVRGRFRFSRQQPPLFSWRDNHVAATLVGDAAVYVLHTTAKSHKRQAPRRVGLAHVGQLVAATLTDGRYGGVIALGDEIGLWNGGAVRRVPRPPDDALRLVPGQADLLWCERFDGGAGSYVLLDDARRLVCWREHGRAGPVPFKTIAPDVIGGARAGQDRLVYVTFRERRADLHYWKQTGSTRHVARLVRVETRTRPLRCLVAGVREGAAWRGIVAIEWRSDVVGDEMRHWTLASVRTDTDGVSLQRPSIAAGWKIVGAVRSAHPHAVDGFGLLAIDANAQRLVVAGAGGHAELHAAGGEIANASVSADGARIAFVDASRQLVVLAHDGKVLLRTSHHDARDD